MYPHQDPRAAAILKRLQPGARLDGADKNVDPDMVAMDSAGFAANALSLQAAAAVQTWCETDLELDEGEGKADRLFALMVGIADDNKDGELDDDEKAVVEMAFNAAWDYMVGKGVAEADLEDLYGDDPVAANAAGDRICEMLADKLPEGEAADDDIDDFAFGSDASEGVFDAVYKKRFAIRGGKKTIIRKRVAGTVRLSAKQKVAIRKAQRKSGSAKAMMKRMKSMRVSRAMGLSKR